MSDIKYPIFEELRAHTDDPGWNTILSDASRGKFLDGISYRNGSIVKTGKTRRKISYKLPLDTNKALVKFQIIMRKLGFKTELDTTSEQLADLARTEKGWQAIRSETVRLFYIKFYIAALAEKYDLNTEEERTVSHSIILHYILNHIDNKAIIFKNGYIQDINGVHWNNKTRTLFFNHLKTTKESSAKLS